MPNAQICHTVKPWSAECAGHIFANDIRPSHRKYVATCSAVIILEVFYRHMILPETSTKRNEKRPSIKRIQDTIVPIHRLATGQAATSQYLVQLISIQNLWSRGKRIGKVPLCNLFVSSLEVLEPFTSPVWVWLFHSATSDPRRQEHVYWQGVYDWQFMSLSMLNG